MGITIVHICSLIENKRQTWKLWHWEDSSECSEILAGIVKVLGTQVKVETSIWDKQWLFSSLAGSSPYCRVCAHFSFSGKSQHCKSKKSQKPFLLGYALSASLLCILSGVSKQFNFAQASKSGWFHFRPLGSLGEKWGIWTLKWERGLEMMS